MVVPSFSSSVVFASSSLLSLRHPVCRPKLVTSRLCGVGRFSVRGVGGFGASPSSSAQFWLKCTMQGRRGLKSQIENAGEEGMGIRGWREEGGLTSKIENAGETCWPTTKSRLHSHSISLPLLQTLAP